jgi:hypothetical protein
MLLSSVRDYKSSLRLMLPVICELCNNVNLLSVNCVVMLPVICALCSNVTGYPKSHNNSSLREIQCTPLNKF